MFPVVGRHGKRRTSRWKEPTVNEWSDNAAASLIWRNDARRCLVDSAAAGLYRAVDFHYLFHVGGISGKELFRWQLHFAVLFAGNFRGFTAQLVRTETRVVAGLAYFLPRVVSSVGTRRISGDVLLLPRRILQGVLGRSPSLHRGRATQNLLGRTVVPAHYPKCASLLSLPSPLFSRRPLYRRLEGAMVCGWIRNWSRHNCARNQRRFAWRLHVWLSFATASGRGFSRPDFALANM